MNISLSPFAPEKLVSQDWFGRPVPRQHADSPHSGRIWCLLTGFLPISAVESVYVFRHTLSSQSRVYRVTQLRTGGVHCREYAGTMPVNVKVVLVTGAAVAGHLRPVNVRLSCPTTIVGMLYSIMVILIVIL